MQAWYDEMEQHTNKPEKDRTVQLLIGTALLPDAEHILFSGDWSDL